MLKKKSKYVMAILGATGAVGKETLDILEARKFPLESLRLFASKRSAGGTLSCQGKEWTIEELTPETSFAGVDFALISATDAISRDYGRRLGAGLLASRDVEADVLKAAHHGSRYSSTVAFLRAVRRSVVVVSPGWLNSFGFPHKETLERYTDAGAVVMRTDVSGAVTVETDGRVLSKKAYLTDREL